MIHASDSEAHTDGRALLFAEDHLAEPKGRNPRPRQLWAAGGFAIERERVFPSRRVSTGSAQRIGRNRLRKRTVLMGFRVVLS